MTTHDMYHDHDQDHQKMTIRIMASMTMSMTMIGNHDQDHQKMTIRIMTSMAMSMTCMTMAMTMIGSDVPTMESGHPCHKTGMVRNGIFMAMVSKSVFFTFSPYPIYIYI